MTVAKYTIVSLAVQKSGGGPTKTIGAFKRALNAELYSFCDPGLLKEDPLSVPGANPVNAMQLPFAREFMWPSRQSAHDAEQACADSNMISCHSFYRYHTLWMNRIYKKYGTPYWFVPHGILDPWVMETGRLVKEAYWVAGGKRFLENAKTVIFSTSAERDKSMTQFELPGAEVLPWPVELVDCTGSTERRNYVRGRLNIPEEARVLLYFGRMHSMKKPLETIRSVAQARDESLHLIMVGNEQDVSLKDCYAVADECRISPRVHVVGAVYGQEKFDYMMAADAYISLSHRENFNHTAAESLSAGLPVILSPGNDLQADIHSANCSWGLRDESLEVASQTIEEFSQTPLDKLQSMGARGREWVEENLQFSIFAERLQLIAKKYGRSL